MQIFEVGGAVRDELLGLPVKDRDFVVVGATPEDMVRDGFRPVGKDFPVFLHPVTHEEYALARTERKTGRGYKGFQVYASPEVTLEEDLARRDLTINALARGADGNIVDPFGGLDDLRSKVLRHVSAAFVEDPVRILRVARFAARFVDFSIAPETHALMRSMVEAGEVDALVPERVWQEVAKGLQEAKPSRMLLALRECGALARIMPELDRLFGVPQPVEHHPEVDTGLHILLVVDYAAAQNYPLAIRFAALVHDLGKGLTDPAAWPHHYGHEARGEHGVRELCRRLRVPNDCRDLAVMTARHHGVVHQALELRAATLLKLIEATDGFRQPERFEAFLAACECDFRGRPGREDAPYPQRSFVSRVRDAAAAVPAGEIAQKAQRPDLIKQRIHEARVRAIEACLKDDATGSPG